MFCSFVLVTEVHAPTSCLSETGLTFHLLSTLAASWVASVRAAMRVYVCVRVCAFVHARAIVILRDCNRICEHVRVYLRIQVCLCTCLSDSTCLSGLQTNNTG